MNSFDSTYNAHNAGGEPVLPLSREEMEALLPDYAFGDLPELERGAFERSLAAYPDLTDEIRELQDAFAPVDKNAINKAYSQRLKNLSVHVQTRLDKEFAKAVRRRRFFRFLAPVLAAACLVGLVALPQGVFNVILSDSAAPSTMELIRPDEAQLILDDESLADGVSELDIAFVDRTVVDSPSPDIAAKEALLAAKLIDKETLQALSAASDNGISDELSLLQDIDDDDVDESDVQTLLTEML